MYVSSHLIQLDIGSLSYLISEFCRSLKVFSVEHASPMGPAVMEEGGGGGGQTGFLFSS